MKTRIFYSALTWLLTYLYVENGGRGRANNETGLGAVFGRSFFANDYYGLMFYRFKHLPANTS